MKILGILRHAKSSWEDLDVRDFDRVLNQRGHKGARLMGQHMQGHGLRYERVIASTAARVRETLADINAVTTLLPPVEWDERLYLASPGTIMDVLREAQGGPKSILVSGHNPGLQELVLELAQDEGDDPTLDAITNKFPTAAYAVLELEIDDWGELAPGCGRLVDFARPRDLDASLGPELMD